MRNLIKDIIVNNLHSQPIYLRWLKNDLADCDSILELGCGADSPLLKIGYGHKTHAVDIWEPYINKHTAEQNYKSCETADIMTMQYPQNKYDAVVICDVLEHLDKAEFYRKQLFKKIESTARKKVIIFTPNGFIENDEVDGDPYQRHVSSWAAKEYRQAGYKVFGATGLHFLYGKAGIVKRKPKTFMEYFGQFSQLFIYFFPEIAWHSYAVKEL